MYLTQLYIENNGPLKTLSFELPFSDSGLPKPAILVGGNGSGKTNLLSRVADALFQAASRHFDDALVGSTAMSRPFFRLAGGTTIKIGETGSLALLQFTHSGKSFLYREKAGKLKASDVSARLPQSLANAANWSDEGVIKDIDISDDESGDIFKSGVYVYFPSSRAEIPDWQNTEAELRSAFDRTVRISKRLKNTIFVERGIDNLSQWIASVIVDARVDISAFMNLAIPNMKMDQVNFSHFLRAANVSLNLLQQCNQLLSRILEDDQMHFIWSGRHLPQKVAIAKRGVQIVPSLESLSAGQSTLLVIFGTLLRYADSYKLDGLLLPRDISGICLIDEIDAHMHVDLQYRALPALIRLFPKVQFIVSSHSPLFVLGMEKEFGADQIAIVEMPGGRSIQAEAYSEFGRALRALQNTEAFADAIEKAVGTPGKMLVLMEGETDPIYARCAAELLGRTDISENVEFDWVGAKDRNTGQGFYTGKSALDNTRLFAISNPSLIQRELMLLYDNDTHKDAEDRGKVHTRCIESNPLNTVASAGIENLLPSDVFTEDMFDVRTTRKSDGGMTVVKTLNKMKLCKDLCEVRRDRSTFMLFGAMFDMIAATYAPEAHGGDGAAQIDATNP